MRHPVMTTLAAWILCTGLAHAAGAAWIEESNRYAQWLLDAQAISQPENAANLGVEGHDGEVLDLKPRNSERAEAELAAVAAKLDAARATVTDDRVKQDLQILVQSARLTQHTSELNRRLMIPYFDLGRALFSGFQDLLDARVEKKRQAAALVRLKRYAGNERGYEPIAILMRARIEERMGDTSLTWPWVVEVQQNLDNSKRYIDGMRELLQKSGLKGWQKDFAALSHQLDEYTAWVRGTVLPRARKTNQLPLEIYTDNLKNFGVDADPKDVMQRALFAYMQTRDEMDAVARKGLLPREHVVVDAVHQGAVQVEQERRRGHGRHSRRQAAKKTQCSNTPGYAGVGICGSGQTVGPLSSCRPLATRWPGANGQPSPAHRMFKMKRSSRSW